MIEGEFTTAGVHDFILRGITTVIAGDNHHSWHGLPGALNQINLQTKQTIGHTQIIRTSTTHEFPALQTCLG
jgi:hypothetical protein